MKTRCTLFIFLLLIPIFSFSQTYNQYFDGADTSVYNSIFIELDSAADNIWQIGIPQKNIFNTASTIPNAIVTDTINYYPPLNTSSFTFDLPEEFLEFPNFSIIAFEWNQKLDMDANFDGGIIEFSGDNGQTWSSAFDNPYVYNFYGFDEENKDTLQDGTLAFTGTDEEWKNIWFCFEIGWLITLENPIKVRFTFMSDENDNQKEGWMIDNMLIHWTFVHTISEEEQEEYLKVFPNPAKNGIINIQAKKFNEFHIIEKMELRNVEGKLIREYGVSPTKFHIDISDQPAGIYYLMIQTNKKQETIKIIHGK